MTKHYFGNKDLFLKTMIGVKAGFLDDYEYKQLIFDAPRSVAIFFESDGDWYNIDGQILANKKDGRIITIYEIKSERVNEKKSFELKILVKNRDDNLEIQYEVNSMERLDYFFQKYMCIKDKCAEDSGSKNIENEVVRGHGIKSGKPT